MLVDVEAAGRAQEIEAEDLALRREVRAGVLDRRIEQEGDDHDEHALPEDCRGFLGSLTKLAAARRAERRGTHRAWRSDWRSDRAHRFSVTALEEPAGARRRAGCALQRIGGAYCRPPLVQRLFRPRGSLSGEPAPTLRSKTSP